MLVLLDFSRLLRFRVETWGVPILVASRVYIAVISKAEAPFEAVCMLPNNFLTVAPFFIIAATLFLLPRWQLIIL